MKNLRIIIFSIFALLAICSCNKDTELSPPLVEQDNALTDAAGDRSSSTKVWKKMTWEEVQNDPQYMEIIQGLGMDLAHPMPPGDNLVLDTRNITKCSDLANSYFSFTFPVTPDPDFQGSIRNVLLEKKYFSYHSKVVEYTISQSDLYAYMTGTLTAPLFVPMDVYPVDPNTVTLRGCEWVEVQFVFPCPCAQHTNPSVCSCSTQPTVIDSGYWECDDGPGGNDTNGGITIYTTGETGTNNDSGGGGPPHPGSDNNDGAGTEMLIPTAEWYLIKLTKLKKDYNLDWTVDQLEDLIPMSCMGDGNPPLGVFEACAKEILIDQLGINISQAQTNYLVNNFEIYESLSNFKNGYNHLLELSKTDAMESYVALLESDSDFRTYALSEHPAMPSWMWPFLREIGMDIAVELVKKYGPAGIVNDVLDAVNDLQQGDILGFMGEVIDIVRRKVPALAAVSIALDGIDLGSKATKAWRALAKMEKYGDAVVEKTLSTIRDHVGDILGKFKWKNKNIGAELFDVANPQNFVDDLLAKFPSFEGPTFNNPLFPLEATYTIGNLKLIFYPVSNSTGGPTLTFKLGSNQFKIRFQ